MKQANKKVSRASGEPKAGMEAHGSKAGNTNAVLSILKSLRRIQQQIEQGSQSLESQHGVTQPQLLCLRSIRDAGEICLTELSTAIHLSPSTLVGVVDRLEAKGLIIKTRGIDDRRRIRIQLTQAGSQKVREAPDPIHARLNQALRLLPTSQQNEMACVLDRLVHMMGGGHADAPPIVTSGPIPKTQDQEATLSQRVQTLDDKGEGNRIDDIHPESERISHV